MLKRIPQSALNFSTVKSSIVQELPVNTMYATASTTITVVIVAIIITSNATKISSSSSVNNKNRSHLEMHHIRKVKNSPCITNAQYTNKCTQVKSYAILSLSNTKSVLIGFNCQFDYPHQVLRSLIR